MKNFKGAIFDVDGTLLDSMPAWENLGSDYLKSQGIQPRPDLREELRILGGHQIPEYFRSEYGVIGSVDEIQSALNGMLEDFYFNKSMAKDGVVEMLEALSKNTKMCVATATDRHLVAPALERCGLTKYFSRIFTCGEEDTNKSSPDIYLRAAEHLGTAVSETIVFEDALYAVKTAKEAGFIVAGIYDLSAQEGQDEIRSICDIYLKSWRDFEKP